MTTCTDPEQDWASQHFPAEGGNHEAMFLSENIKAVGDCGDRKKRHFL